MSDEQRTPCCVIHSEYPMGADVCAATKEEGDQLFRCTRPENHDGGHVACNGRDENDDPDSHDHAEVWF